MTEQQYKVIKPLTWQGHLYQEGDTVRMEPWFAQSFASRGQVGELTDVGEVEEDGEADKNGKADAPEDSQADDGKADAPEDSEADDAKAKQKKTPKDKQQRGGKNK
jgi:hypothetical protein